MRYGSYQLNPGDMFEVDPDKVMYAAGKDKNQASLEAAIKRVEAKEQAKTIAEEEAIVELEEGTDVEAAEGAAAEQAEAQAEEVVAAAEEAAEEPDLSEIPKAEREKEQRRRVKALIDSAKTILKEDTDLNAKRKQELRAFVKASKSALGRTEDLTSDDLMEQLSTHLSRFKLDDSGVTAVKPDESAETPKSDAETTPAILSKTEQNKLLKILRANEEDDENPVDPSKPYATPWQPRKFLEPFAFIPRYLEVNQNICAAVYLRHPVARRGLAEVPTPFPYDVNQLAYTWYLRRR